MLLSFHANILPLGLQRLLPLIRRFFDAMMRHGAAIELRHAILLSRYAGGRSVAMIRRFRYFQIYAIPYIRYYYFHDSDIT